MVVVVVVVGRDRTLTRHPPSTVTYSRPPKSVHGFTRTTVPSRSGCCSTSVTCPTESPSGKSLCLETRRHDVVADVHGRRVRVELDAQLVGTRRHLARHRSRSAGQHAHADTRVGSMSRQHLRTAVPRFEDATDESVGAEHDHVLEMPASSPLSRVIVHSKLPVDRLTTRAFTRGMSASTGRSSSGGTSRSVSSAASARR